jgi:molecular chaperone HtpG
VETHRFEANVRQILDLVTHSLYSDREIFLRELISNASDALDRARFEGLSRDDLLPAEDPGIRVLVDEAAGTLTIQDDGIGLSAAEAIEHLGTIAQSGTRAFSEALKRAGKEGEGLVGQFGVGFYSAFMVADTVEVWSRSAVPGTPAIHWRCSGGEEYALEEVERERRGTDVVLHLREDARAFLDEDTLKDIVKKHSDYIAWPIRFGDERVNQTAALWTRDPKDIGDDEYKALYRHVSGDWNDPLAHIHVRAEGTLQFQAVLFIPRSRPWEMDRMDFKTGLRLYQKRVKVLDHADALLPRYLRFVAGIVDSPDVELNVSREILQQTPVLGAIKKQLVKRVLRELERLAEERREDYAHFWGELGQILKEGIADQDGQKDKLAELLRFRTTQSAGAEDPVDRLRSLRQVKDGRAEGQEAIWYHTSVDRDRIADAPVLEGFKKRGWEVLLMDDPVDEWVVMSLREYDGVPLQSVSRGEVPADTKADEDPIAKAAREQAAPLAAWMNGLLGDDVADVRLSSRLTDSPSVLVDEEGAMGANLERILKAANQQVQARKRVLELNPEHPMVKTLARLCADGKPELEPFARLLLDHAHISEGRMDDPQGFARRLQTLMEKASAAL